MSGWKQIKQNKDIYSRKLALMTTWIAGKYLSTKLPPNFVTKYNCDRDMVTSELIFACFEYYSVFHNGDSLRGDKKILQDSSILARFDSPMVYRRQP